MPAARGAREKILTRPLATALGRLFAVTALGLYPSLASADPAIACFAAAERGQELERAGKLNEARARFAECSLSSCPADVASDCRAWAQRTDAQLATVLFLAVGPDGRPVQDAQVRIDGGIVAERLDGRPIAIEPGPHRVRIVRRDSFVDESVVLQPGERGRVVLARLPEARRLISAPAEGPIPSVPATVYVFGGLGAVSLVGFGVLAILGTKKLDDLRTECGPTCPDSDRSAARNLLIAADLSLAVGVASLTTAAILFFTRPRASTAPRTEAGLSVVGLREGGMVGFAGAF